MNHLDAFDQIIEVLYQKSTCWMEELLPPVLGMPETSLLSFSAINYIVDGYMRLNESFR
jgi:hypothetical protein